MTTVKLCYVLCHGFASFLFCSKLRYCLVFLFRVLQRVYCKHVRLRCVNCIFVIVPLRQLICILLHPKMPPWHRVAPAVLTVYTVLDDLGTELSTVRGGGSIDTIQDCNRFDIMSGFRMLPAILARAFHCHVKL